MKSTTLILQKKFAPGTKSKFSKHFKGKKIRYLDRYKYTQRELFFNFFLGSFGEFVPAPNAKKWYFSDLVPVLKVNLEYLENKHLIFHFCSTGKVELYQNVQHKNLLKIIYSKYEFWAGVILNGTLM